MAKVFCRKENYVFVPDIVEDANIGKRLVVGVVTPSSRRAAKSPQDYYSAFHQTPNRKKFSEEEWKDFTEESTREAVAELASSPEFTDWMIKNADRIRLQPEGSSDESIGSGSDSTDENVVAQSSSGRGLFWQHRL
ncbi:hypothetical protein CDL12_18823 [Handroanthus impetiginosus]|uniref:Uncharacterized protein n=1 Tax=Handroanthus impetiginosus TaxID=429701 RepID=A0A2G9GTL2_9LAMI|nr:hypothetical protein CDL12_18823 [Handroanthus impetiginosus]